MPCSLREYGTRLYKLRDLCTTLCPPTNRMPHLIPRASGWEIDLAHETISWSDRATRLIGLETPAPGIPLTQFLEAIHPADRARVRRAVNRGIERGRMRVRFRVVLSSGAIRQIVANGILTVDATDRDARRIVGWFEPRTGRRRVERSMRTSAQRMALAAAAADVGFWRIDLVTQKRWLSPFALGIFGLGPHDTQTAEMFYAAVHPEDRERVRATRARVTAERSRLDDVFRVIRLDGMTRWLHSIAVVLRDEHTGHDYMIGVTADVTDRVLAQQELMAQQRQLAHLARVAVVGELSGAIAHVVGQPSTVIITNARAVVLMLEEAGPIDRAVFLEILDDITDAGERAGVVLQRIRGFIRNEPLVTGAVHLSGLVTEVLAMMRRELLAHQVVVHVEVDASLPPVRGDRVQLQQVLVNLIINACDAMVETAPADRCIVITGAANLDGSCELIITDRGPGIALGQTESIFEPFVTSKVNGTGLGLAICRKVVSQHGGQLRAESNSNGATFHLVLPGVEGLSVPMANAPELARVSIPLTHGIAASMPVQTSPQTL